MLKKCSLPAKRAFEIHFLTQLCRVKKYFYPRKCLGDGYALRCARGADVRRKSSNGTFSTVSNPRTHRPGVSCISGINPALRRPFLQYLRSPLRRGRRNPRLSFRRNPESALRRRLLSCSSRCFRAAVLSCSPCS